MVSQMRENQGGFGVTDEGDLVSQMRGLPTCGHDQLTLCKHLLSFSWVDVKFRIGITGFVLSWSPTSLPSRLSTATGGSSHWVPEFSLHRKRILSLWSTSSSRRARIRIAMDLDLPAPNNPWMHKSSRLVRRAIVTAQSVPRTCPSISAA